MSDTFSYAAADDDPARRELNRRRLLATDPPLLPPDSNQPTSVARNEQPAPSPQRVTVGQIPPPPPMPPEPHFYDIRPPEQGQFSSPFQVFQNPMVLMAGLASMLTRQPLTTAMNAAGSAMKGYTQGQKDVFQQNKEIFHENLEAAVAQNKVELDKYHAAWDRSKELNWRQVYPKLYSEAAANNDQLMMAALQTGNWELVEKILVGRETAQTKLETVMATLQARSIFQKQQIGESSLTSETIDFFADQELAGDHSWKTGVGRGIQGKGDINAVMERAQQKATSQNMTGADLAQRGAEYVGAKSAQRTLGGYQAKLSQASNAVDYFADQALEASQAFPRGSVVPINKAIQGYQAGTSDPKLYDLGFALFSLVNAYARAINPQGVPRIQDKEHANQYISTATSPQALEAVIARLKKEVEAERQAVEKTRQEFRGQGQTEPSAPVRVQTPADAQKLPPGTHYLTPDNQEYVR